MLEMLSKDQDFLLPYILVGNQNNTGCSEPQTSKVFRKTLSVTATTSRILPLTTTRTPLTKFKSMQRDDLLGSLDLAINGNIYSTTQITGPTAPSTSNISISTTMFDFRFHLFFNWWDPKHKLWPCFIT